MPLQPFSVSLSLWSESSSPFTHVFLDESMVLPARGTVPGVLVGGWQGTEAELQI